MPLWYAETRHAASPAWAPVTFTTEPQVTAPTDGSSPRLVQAGSIGPRIRRVKEVATEHEGLHLGALAAIYGEERGDA